MRQRADTREPSSTSSSRKATPSRWIRSSPTFAGLFAGNSELQKALANPAVPFAAKRKVVESLVLAHEARRAALGKLLLMLADRDRLTLVPELAEVYRERLMEHQQVDQRRSHHRGAAVGRARRAVRETDCRRDRPRA